MNSIISPLSFTGAYFNQYHIIARINNYVLPILIDTGSSISCIQSKFCTSFQTILNPLHISRCFDTDFELDTSTMVKITFDNIKYYDLLLFVSNPGIMEIPVVLGIDFLEVLQSFTITYDRLFLTIDNYTHTINRILLSQQEINKQLGL